MKSPRPMQVQLGRQMKANLISALSGLLIGAACVWYFYPRIETTYQDRVKVETRIVTRIKEVKSKDGSSTTTTEIVDTGKRLEDLKLIKLAPRYLAGASVAYNWGHFNEPDYAILGGIRIVGPLFGTATVSSKQTQIGLLLEF